MLKIRFYIGLTLLLFALTGAHGQIIKTKLDIVGGVSAREYLHGGLRYQYTDITQLGAYFGGDLGVYPEIITTWCVDNAIHFGSHGFYTNRPVWYARQGFTYKKSIASDRTYYFSYIDLSGGREFGIKNWLGVNIDLGVILQVREKMEWKDPGLDEIYNTRWYTFALFRFQVFISL